MPSHSAVERRELVKALSDAGPEAPTLCAGWTTTDLAVHLVTRENRPDATLSSALPGLSAWAERVRRATRAWPYPRLLETIGSGPPRTSLMALPGVDARINLAEHFVHCEDVRRAVPGWTPRDLPPARQEALWATLGFFGRVALRPSPVSVVLRTPDGLSRQAVTRSPAGGTAGLGGGVALLGAPSELLLYILGRTPQARVQLEGPDPAVEAFRAVTLSL